MNDKLMHSIGTDRNGNLPETNFVKYFDLSLATEKAAFDINVKQFMECAEACRKRKIEKRQAKKVDAGPNPLDELQKESDMLKRELKAPLWQCIFCCCVSFSYHSVTLDFFVAVYYFVLVSFRCSITWLRCDSIVVRRCC